MRSNDLRRVSDYVRFLILSPICLFGVARFAVADGAETTASAAPGLSFAAVPLKQTVPFEPTAEDRNVPEQFRLPAHEFEYEAAEEAKNGKVRVFKLKYPSPVVTEVAVNNTVHAEYFQPAGAGPYPGCVVLHILGGECLLSQTIANHLAQNGVAALFVKMPYYGERRSRQSPLRMISPDPEQTVAGMTQAVLDIRRAAAWLAQRSEVDSRNLGITGISLGGIMSALAGAAEPRFGSVAIYLGGGNFADFLWENSNPQAVEFREKWIAGGETKESFAKLISRVDPVTYGHLLKGRRVLMVAAENDEIVLPQNARALWESIGKEPRLVWLDAGHYTAAKFLPRELVRLDMFFRGR
jgi:dienelactone hydrolase